MYKEYWEKSLTLEQYLEENKRRLNSPSSQEEQDFKKYYELAEQRMIRTIKSFKKDPELTEKLESKNFTGKILIISEPWCGDASATVPAVAKFFEDTTETRIFLRDSDTTLIDKFLTAGTRSIPIVVLLNENYEEIAHWGPRSAYGTSLLKKFKEDPEAYPRETFYNDLQVYYAKNKGKDSIEEILDLL